MTLEDITKTNDFKPYGGYFYFEKKSKRAFELYGSKSITLQFCLGKVYSISEKSYVLKSDLSKFKNRDKRLFPNMKFEEKK